jgi:hypothetical protein
MKKNILIIQSLLVLPLISSSVLFSMETTQPINEQQKKGIHASLVDELKAKFESKAKATRTSDPIDIVMPSINLVVSEIEVTTLPMPENLKQKTEQPNPLLLQSVMLPTEKKGLGFFKRISYLRSSDREVLEEMITDLKDGAFDVTNGTHFDILNEVIATATKNGDFESIFTIAKICSEKYPNKIRISDETAKPTSEFLSTHYLAELQLAQNKSPENGEAVNTYNLAIKNVNENNHIKNLRTNISTFALLNKETRKPIAAVLTNNQLVEQTNIFSKTMSQSTNELNSIVANLNRIPKILETKTKTVTNILALEQK